MQVDTPMKEIVQLALELAQKYSRIPLTLSLINSEGERKLYLYETIINKEIAKIWDSFALILNINGAKSYSFIHESPTLLARVGVGHVTKFSKHYHVYKVDGDRKLTLLNEIPSSAVKGHYFELFDLADRIARGTYGEKFPVVPMGLRERFEQATFDQLLAGVNIEREINSDCNNRRKENPRL